MSNNQIVKIPKNWKYRQLSQITLKPISGSRPTGGASSQGIPSLGGEHIEWDGSIKTNNMKYVPEEHYNNMKKGRIKEGDILLVKDGATIGKLAYIEELPFDKVAINEHLFILRPKKEINSKFLYYYLTIPRAQYFIKRVTTGSAQPGINSKFTRYIPTPVPPLVEQRGVVEVLGCVDECIRLTDEVIGAAEELKRGLMQWLITQGIGHTEYKQTPLGKIPKTWNISSIGKEFNVGTGGTPKRSNSEYYNGTIPWVKSTEINQDIITNTEEYLTKEGIANSNASIYPSGSLLIAMYGQGKTRGKCALLGIDASINQALAAIVQKSNKITIKFLKYWLDLNYNKIRSLSQGANQSNLNLRIIKSIKIPIPSIYEQESIVRVIENQDLMIRNEKDTKSSFEKIKQGLMQLLLSGKVRVELREDGLHRVGDSRETYN